MFSLAHIILGSVPGIWVCIFLSEVFIEHKSFFRRFEHATGPNLMAICLVTILCVYRPVVHPEIEASTSTFKICPPEQSFTVGLVANAHLT